jgi:CheY-like chemotaxis protein
LKPLTVLLVDDSITTLKLTQNVIEYKGHIVETANNGLDAKNKMFDKYYDVVLIDFIMPIMGGIETTRLFREFEESAINAGRREKKQLIVGMSTKKDNEMMKDGLFVGMDDFILKPFNLYTFINMIFFLRPEYVNSKGSSKNSDSIKSKGSSKNSDSIKSKGSSKNSDSLGNSRPENKTISLLDVIEKYLLSKEIKN